MKKKRENDVIVFSLFPSSLAKDIRGQEEKRDEYKDEKKKTLEWSTTNEKKKKKKIGNMKEANKFWNTEEE